MTIKAVAVRTFTVSTTLSGTLTDLAKLEVKTVDPANPQVMGAGMPDITLAVKDGQTADLPAAAQIVVTMGNPVTGVPSTLTSGHGFTYDATTGKITFDESLTVTGNISITINNPT